MILDALQQVARELGVEELHGQLHQLDEEVGDERHVDAGADVQQDLAADKVDGRAAEEQHQLGNKYQPDKADVPARDTRVDDGLGEEREDELQEAADEQPQDELPEEALVFRQVLPEELHAVAGRNTVALLFIKKIGRFQQQGDAFFLAARAGAEPVSAELLAGIGEQSLAGIGHRYFIAFPVVLYTVHHHKMLLVPVNDAGKRSFLRQLVEGKAAAHGVEADLLRRAADAQQRHAVAADEAVLPQALQRIVPTVMPGDHAQAGRATVH